MKTKPRRFISNAFFWTATLFISLCFALTFAVFSSPLREDALKVMLKEEAFKGLELKNFTLKKKSFDFSKLKWSFELNAQIEKVWGVPMQVSDLCLEGTKEVFGETQVKRAVMRFGEESKVFKGGLILNKTATGDVVWDLSNLDFSIGALEKKSGIATFLNVESVTENGFKAQFIFDGIKIPLDVSYAQDSVVIQIPKTQLKTHKQKLPFKGLSQIPTSGEWTFASRVQMNAGAFSEASMLEVTNALVSLANVETSFLTNGRGVGLLNLKISSSEGSMIGKLDVDLEKATFELNEGRYFKVDGAPFKVSADLDQNAANLEIISEANSRLVAELSKDSSVAIKFKEFDLAIVPKINSVFGSPLRGFISGEASAELVSDPLGALSIKINSLRADSADAIFETFKLPGLNVVGNAGFTGSFAANKDRKKIDGRFDFTKSSVVFSDFYKKEIGKELLVRIKADNVDNKWKTFDLSTSVDEQPIEIKGREGFISFTFPKTYRTANGALVSGTVSYPFCGEVYCNMTEATSYDLKLSDYESKVSYLQDLKLSGRISKTADSFEADSLVLRWPSGDQITVDGSLEKFKQGKLKVEANFNYSNLELSNPFLFFKELPLQKAKLDISFLLLQDGIDWKFSGNAELANRKLSFDELNIQQGANVQYIGRAELNLEPYLLRNEAVTLTSTLKTKGNFSAFKNLPVKGLYDAELVLASSGLNTKELISRLKLRAYGDADIDQLPMTLLIKQGLDSYAKEKQKSAANILAKCYPKKFKGKFDFDYSQGRWNLAPSAFQGVDKDSMIKLQGVLGDLSSVNLISHYLPGPSCNAELAACLGDAFPKGGMSFEITGPFKDPETDLDFAFIDQSLERCREIEAKREIATEAVPDTRDQKIRIEELKSFYNSRNLSR